MKSKKSQFYISICILSVLLFVWCFVFLVQTEDVMIQASVKQADSMVSVSQYHKLQATAGNVLGKYEKVDTQIPGISTADGDFFLSRYRAYARDREFEKAYTFLSLADSHADYLIVQQKKIVPYEIDRLSQRVSSSIDAAEEVFAYVNDIEQTYLYTLSSNTDDLKKLSVLRSLLVTLANRIHERTLAMKGAIKSIVVSKSNKKLYMYEDEKEVYVMPISLGRLGRETRTGEFKILDKMEKVWGYYQIWMPYWMGIYFAGSSENGLHGIPWDSAGNKYWEKDIGKNNVTYGCVMSDDENMRKLFHWAEIGTPITIVE